MYKKIISFFLAALMAGFIACSGTTNSLIEEAQTNITQQNYEAAIAATDSFIQQMPQNPLGYYYKGVALGQKGQAQEAPPEGTPFFKQMNEAFQQSKHLAAQAEETPEEISRIGNVKTGFWRVAHNRGVQLLQSDSLRNTVQNPMQRALAFFNNAAIIQPDSAVTYRAKAIVSGNLQQYAQAAEAQQKFINLSDSVSVRNYLVLAQYYRRAEMPNEGLQVLLEAQKEFPDNTRINAFLVDAYTQTGDSEKAIALVRELVEQNPDNPQYRLSLGSRILISAANLQDSYEQNVNQIFELQRQLGNVSGNEDQHIQQQIETLRQKNQQLRNEIIQLQNEAEEQFKLVLQYRPDDATAYHNLGVIYQNRAALYYDLRNLAQERAQSRQYDQQADDLLREALTYYERAAEIEPDNTQYWRKLYVVYTTLGLDEQANQAAQKAGIQQ